MTSWPEFRPDFPYKGKKSVLDISVQGVGRLHLWNVFKTQNISDQALSMEQKDGFIYFLVHRLT